MQSVSVADADVVDVDVEAVAALFTFVLLDGRRGAWARAELIGSCELRPFAYLAWRQALEGTNPSNARCCATDEMRIEADADVDARSFNSSRISF